MKINVFLTAVAVIIAVLIGYYAFSIAEGNENAAICGVCSSLCFVGTLIPIIGLQYSDSRLGVNIRMCSALFCVVFLVSHFSFAALGVKMPYYIIVNGIMLLVFLAILYKMQGMNNV